MSHVALESASPTVPTLEVASVRPRPILLAALTAVVAVAAMCASVAGEYVFDDIPLIEGNSYVHSFEHWTRWFTGTLWDSNFDPALVHESRDFWRPLVLLSYAVNWTMGAGSPVVFHVTNLLLHALNVALFTLVLLGWVKRAWPALIGALLFAVHPVQTEPVAWIAGRTDTLCTLGLLLATLGLRRARTSRAWGGALTGIGLLIAFLSKEAAVVFPVLAAIELWSEHERPLTADSVKAVLRRVWPYLALALAYVAIIRLFASSTKTALGLTASNHPLLVLEAVGRYSALVLWPDDLTLGRAQLRFAGSAIAPSWAYSAAGGLSLALLFTLAWRARLRTPLLSLGLLAYTGMLLPVSGIVWLGNDVLVSPRFLYEPMLGASLACATLIAARRQGAIERSLCVLVLACLATRSFMRAGDFESAQAFWRREISSNASYSPAQQYYLYRELKAGRPRSALRVAQRWFDLTRTDGTSEVHKGNLIMGIAAAALNATPDLNTADLENLQAFVERLSSGEPAKLRLPRLGLELDVGNHRVLLESMKRSNQRLWTMAAEAAVRRADDATAVSLSERALASCSDCWTMLSTHALILARAGQLERARAIAERALSLAPPGKITELVAIVDEAIRWERLRGSGPPAVIEAGLQSALGGFGRAYRSAWPAIESPPGEPAAVVSLAELAFRAGDIASARRLLARVLPPDDVERTLKELCGSVTWLDKPSDPDEWLPG